MAFVNLHGHTEHSHLDAIIKVKDLFKRAKELGHEAVAITDHGVMAGLLEGYKEYKATGIKFIPGNEIYFCEDLENPKAKRGHLILLASNQVGYKNLLKLTAEGFKHSAFVMDKQIPRINAEILKKYNEGLYVTSACMSSLIADGIFHNDLDKASGLALLLKDIFGDRFFLELQAHNMKFSKKDKALDQLLFYSQNKLNDELISIAKANKIGLVATCDSHYLLPEDEPYHDMIQAISSKKAISDLDRKRYSTKEPCLNCAGMGVFPLETKTKCLDCQGTGIGKQIPCPEFYLKDESVIFNFFKEHYSEDLANEVIGNTKLIADACENPDYIEPSGNRLPTFSIEHIKQNPDYIDFEKWRNAKPDRLEISYDKAYLRYKCDIRFRQYCKDMSKEDKSMYWARLVEEVSVFENRGFASYMLIVSDYISWAKLNDIYVGPGRGSACGSLVAYFLDIHDIDPIEYGLLFERFVNKFKKELPDIDTDFESARRYLVLDYIKNKWGERYVANISNISKITAKVAIKDIARSLQLGGDKSTAFKLANEITASIPDKIQLPDGKILNIDSFELAMKYSNELQKFIQKFPEVEGYAKAIIGLPRNFSTHAAGLIISDVPLDEYVPLRRDKDNVVALQYDKKGAEAMGLIKVDILSLETLDILRETYNSAKSVGIDLPLYNNIPLGDKKAYKLIQNGHVVGLFQLEGATLSALCKPFKPESVLDLGALNAIGRPSCSVAERRSFINRRFGQEEIIPPHELLEDIFRLSYGHGIYEEQLQLIAQKIAGWDLAKADGLRQLTKLKGKEPHKVELLKQEFINDSIKHSNLSNKVASEIWNNVIITFQGYGFNKSHAVAYGLTGYRTAYYKAHASAPFLCAVLNSKTENNSANRDEKIDKVRKELKDFNISIAPCDINKSKQNYIVLDKKTISTGFSAIKGLGEKAIEEIIRCQPYKSFEDFIFRTSSNKVKKDTIQALAQAGAFDSFSIPRKFAYEYFALVRQELKLYVAKLPEEMLMKDLDGKITFLAAEALDNFPIFFKEKMIKKEVDLNILTDEWTLKEKLTHEKEALGQYLSGTFDKIYPNFFKGGQWIQNFSAIRKMPKNYPVPLEGLVVNVKELTIKNGKSAGSTFGKLTIENIRGETIGITVWADEYKHIKKYLDKGNLPIRGMFKTNEYQGEISLVLDGRLEFYKDVK